MTKTIDIVNEHIDHAKIVEETASVSTQFLVTNIFEFATQALRLDADNPVELIENINKSICALIAKEFNNINELNDFAEQLKQSSEYADQDVPAESILELIGVVDDMNLCDKCGVNLGEYVTQLPIVIGSFSKELLELVILHDVKYSKMQNDKTTDEYTKINIVKIFMLYLIGFAKEGCGVFNIKEKLGD